MPPVGTVSLLFTDIEGSTRLLQRVGERYAEVLEQHRRLLREAFAARGGYEVGTEGDSFLVSFASAADAAAAAAAAQLALAGHAWPDDVELRVRMGIHTGEPTLVAGDYVGLDVHRAARVMAAGHGGQVLLSQTTRDQLDSAHECRDLGEHRLKDLLEPLHLHQLLIDGLRTDFPPLKTLGGSPSNLPTQPNELIGREKELAELGALVSDRTVRLVTLVGPGGTGKTRLALQVAADLVESFSSGVFFVSLASIRDPSLVIAAIARTLAVREEQGESIDRTLAAFLADKNLLLVLDNVEQVLGAATKLSDILAGAPGVKLLVTSRERLRVAGERVFIVPPLPVMPLGAGLELRTLARNPAVALFIARAKALKRDFELTEGNARAIAGVCARVDGLPLAIELAAARIAVLTPQQLLERLDRRLKLLTGGRRDADDRQRTLRDTIAWSHGLLNAADQTLFARSAVFAGGFTLDAAEAVCDPERRLDVLDGIHSLFEQSLLRQEVGGGGEARFSMLETIREYAVERLEAQPDVESIRNAHAEYFLELAKSVEPRLRGADQRAALGALDVEHDNLRAALDWALAEGAGSDRRDLGVRLAGALGRAWYLRAEGREGRMWLERALEAGGSSRDRATVLYALGVLADQGGDPRRATSLLTDSLESRRAVGDHPGVAQALHSLGIVARNRGEPAHARDLLTESLQLRRWLDDPAGVSATTCGLGIIATEAGDFAQARALFEESLALDRALNDRDGIATNALNLGCVALEQNDVQRARKLLDEGLRAFDEIGDQEGVAECLEEIARLAAEQAHPAEAVRLLAAAEGLREVTAIPLTRPSDKARIERRLAGLREVLGPSRFGECYAEGRAFTLKQAVADALALTGAREALAQPD